MASFCSIPVNLSPAPQKRLWQQQIGIVYYFVISELAVISPECFRYGPEGARRTVHFEYCDLKSESVIMQGLTQSASQVAYIVLADLKLSFSWWVYPASALGYTSSPSSVRYREASDASSPREILDHSGQLSGCIRSFS
jgi:hypothetical protein